MSRQTLTTKRPLRPYTVYRVGIDETEQMSREEIVAHFGSELEPTTWLHFRGHDIALDTLARQLIQELLGNTPAPDGFVEQLEPHVLHEFYKATLEKWLEWKLSQGDTRIEVDERYDETTDEVSL